VGDQPTAANVSEADCRREFLFCLLGGHGVTYELARSAAGVLAARGVFGDSSRHGPRLERWLSDLLSRPWYEPRRLDGRGRRYRYPRRKAALLRRADDWLLAYAPSGLRGALDGIDDERTRRNWLCECPGVGPKTASWLLRNIGLGDGLAIIDIHLLRALESTGRAGTAVLPSGYDELEQAFLRWSDDLGAPPAAFDLFLWEYSRGDVDLVLT
jgi:N-glycosylase/DNA lyase